ncbi:hypothetical protein BC830DRAFT_50611 [Chytriomyces sp. MP71]|nr:hypothetical protein BC830DRAFT_50611 [Chytriomyces sp. MP71]
MDNLTWGTFDSLFVIGGAIGSMFGGYLAERYGRRNVLLLTNIPFVATSVLLASSTTVLALFAGRLLAGLAAGICTVTLPMYIAEVAPAQLRGSLGALTQVSLVSGILCVQSLGVSFATRPSWRTMFAAGALPPLLQSLLLPACVESPAWRASRARRDDARKSLMQPESRVGDSNETVLAEGDFAGTGSKVPNEECVSQGSDRSIPMGILDLLKIKHLRRPMIAAAGLQIAQTMSGIGAGVSYSTTIFNQHYPHHVSIWLSLFISFMNVVATLISMALIGRLRRKTQASFSPEIIVASLMGFVGFHGVGLGVVPWLILPELMPMNAIGAASSICFVISWVAKWMMAFLLPIFIGLFGNSVFLLFVVVLACVALFTHFVVPETKREHC